MPLDTNKGQGLPICYNPTCPLHRKLHIWGPTVVNVVFLEGILSKATSKYTKDDVVMFSMRYISTHLSVDWLLEQGIKMSRITKHPDFDPKRYEIPAPFRVCHECAETREFVFSALAYGKALRIGQLLKD
jgi:hypothetical protein